MTRMERIKCWFGMHGNMENVGASPGSILVQGRWLHAEFRIWRCKRCGYETGEVDSSSVMGWSQYVDPATIRKMVMYKSFEKDPT